MNTQSSWPLNSKGEIILQAGTGGASIAGFVSQDSLPSSEQGGIPVVLTGMNAPVAITSRTLTAEDDGKVFVASTSFSVAVDAGMPVGFGSAFKGVVSFTANGGVTLTDLRSVEASGFWCALVNTGVNTYDIIGTKGS